MKKCYVVRLTLEERDQLEGLVNRGAKRPTDGGMPRCFSLWRKGGMVPA